MTILTLPSSTFVNRIVPKNAFDKFTNTKTKKEFTEKVEKIRWLNKLSFETLNLPQGDIKEIQIFEILLKTKDNISGILEIIDKSIPYPIIFIIRYGHEFYISTSKKHPHPTNENLSVLDWVFQSTWQEVERSDFQLELKNNLDYIFNEFCKKISGYNNINLSLSEIIEKEKRIKELIKRKQQIESKISSCKQFNLKLDLNNELNQIFTELKKLSQ